jgi:hypothetical protein
MVTAGCACGLRFRLPAEWRHNKTGLLKKLAVAGVIGGAATALVLVRRSSSKREPSDG